MAQPKRILIVRPSALGDVCRTVPVLASLRRAYPQATIDWLVQEDFAAAIRAHPALDEAVLFPRARFARWWRDPAVAWEMLLWFAALGRRGYDLVFDCQGLGRSGLITWATFAKHRIGLRSAREFGWLGYTIRLPRSSAKHTVQQMMWLLTAQDIEPRYDMSLYVADADRTWWTDRRAELGMAGESYVVLAPTSRWPSKRWPQRSWSALVGPLMARGFGRAILVGSHTEREQVREIVSREPEVAASLIDLVGRTSVGQTMAVIADAALVIGNDSAPLHMAVGFARPCLGLYGPTDPQEVGPYGVDDAVVCIDIGARGESIDYKDPGLGNALMRLIQPADVLGRVDQMFPERQIALTRPGPCVQGDRGSSTLTERAAS
ncbi:MAG: glycosyltransferase family 9 protein [Planctomycetes bacterium]|nr:glycosyltransferase family 9 protein [Planctomycetota bacterium]